MLKFTPVRLEQADVQWVDNFVKKQSNPYESRSNFIRVAIKKLIKQEEENGST
jgi:Arc/MetJ-type ribon-helix-helix transcriptional regulator